MLRKLIVKACAKLPYYLFQYISLREMPLLRSVRISFRYYMFIMAFAYIFMYFPFIAYAAADMWTTANTIIVDLYNKIAGISTVLAGLMSAVAVLGAKLSNNQHKVDQAWDWLRRIWVAWAVINGIGAFIAYIRPLFNGLNTIT